MIQDALRDFLHAINTAETSYLGVVLVAFFVGYMTGGIFTADTIWGRIWRGFIALVLASGGIYDLFIAMKGLVLLGFLAGAAFNLREYINGFFAWIGDLLAGVLRMVYAFFNALIQAFFHLGRSLHAIGYFFATLRVPFSVARERAQARERVSETSSAGSSRPDLEAERRRREDEARQWRANQEAAKKARTKGSEKQEEPNASPPPHREPLKPDPTKNVDDAVRFFGLDKALFTYEDLRQAHKKKVLALHPDKLQSFPDHIRRQLEEEMMIINSARDLIKKWKGWK